MAVADAGPQSLQLSQCLPKLLPKSFNKLINRLGPLKRQFFTRNNLDQNQGRPYIIHNSPDRYTMRVLVFRAAVAALATFLPLLYHTNIFRLWSSQPEVRDEKHAKLSFFASHATDSRSYISEIVEEAKAPVARLRAKGFRSPAPLPVYVFRPMVTGPYQLLQPTVEEWKVRISSNETIHELHVRRLLQLAQKIAEEKMSILFDLLAAHIDVVNPKSLVFNCKFSSQFPVLIVSDMSHKILGTVDMCPEYFDGFLILDTRDFGGNFTQKGITQKSITTVSATSDETRDLALELLRPVYIERQDVSDLSAWKYLNGEVGGK